MADCKAPTLSHGCSPDDDVANDIGEWSSLLLTEMTTQIEAHVIRFG